MTRRHMRADVPANPAQLLEFEEAGRNERPSIRAIRHLVNAPARDMRISSGWGGLTIGTGIGLIITLIRGPELVALLLWAPGLGLIGCGLGLWLAAQYQWWLTNHFVHMRDVEEHTTRRREGDVGSLDDIAEHEERHIDLQDGRGRIWPDGKTIGGLHFSAAIMAQIATRMRQGRGFARIDIPGGEGMDTALYADGTIPDAFLAAGWITGDRQWTRRAYNEMGITPPTR